MRPPIHDYQRIVCPRPRKVLVGEAGPETVFPIERLIEGGATEARGNGGRPGLRRGPSPADIAFWSFCAFWVIVLAANVWTLVVDR